MHHTRTMNSLTQIRVPLGVVNWSAIQPVNAAGETSPSSMVQGRDRTAQRPVQLRPLSRNALQTALAAGPANANIRPKTKFQTNTTPVARTWANM